MELTTFGALLRFALELEGAAAKFYEEGAGAAQGPELIRSFAELRAEGERNRRRLERIRRESVNEMLLESLQGLEEEAYRVELKLSPDTGDDELLALALQFEEALERFYHEVAGQMSLPEVAQGFRRLAEKHAQYKAKLEGHDSASR